MVIMIMRVKKQKVIIITIVFVLLSALVFFLGWTEKTRQKAKIGPPTSRISPTPTLIPIKPIIKQVLDYIESQRLNNGFYNYLAHYDEQCEEKEGKIVCPYEGKRMFPQTNAWTSLAYLAGYQALGEQKYLDLAKRDMDRLILHCESKPEDCLWVLVQVAKLYQETGDSHYLDFLKKEGEILLTKSDSNPLLLDIEIRQLAILYKVTGDNRYLKEAIKRFGLSENSLAGQESLYKIDQFSFPQKACWYTLAKIEIGKQIGNKTYLEEVKTFLGKANISAMANFINFPHPVEIQPCIESYFELAKVTGEETYYQQGKDLLEKFIERFWDGKESKLIYGEGGTIFNPYPELRTYSQKYVVLTDSAYSIYLLAYYLQGP